MANSHYYGFSVLDYSNERSGSKVNFGAVTAINLAGVLAQIGDLRTAIGNIILGVVSSDRWVGDSTILSSTPPAEPTAQVELKFQFTYEGADTHKKFRLEIPTADPSKTVAGSDMVDLTDTDIAAFVTAFEALATSPDDDTESVNIIEGRLVGRNI
jgi:hypothetical protein